MVAGLLRRQRRLNRKADRDPLSVRLVSVRDVVFPPECPACGAPATTTTRLEKHYRFTLHTDDGESVEHQVARLNVSFCATCAERHESEMRQRGRRSDRDTSVSRTIEYVVNPDTESGLPTNEPAWHSFRFQNGEYAQRFRELNARRLWTVHRYAADSAEARRSNAVQLIIMILFVAALALWAYLGR